MIRPRSLLKKILSLPRADAPSARTKSSAEYWTKYTVAQDEHADRDASLSFLSWRNRQYLGYVELMPTCDAPGLSVLDYGCGPGNDLVGFWEESRPQRLIGMDVSPTALAMARRRLRLHDGNVDLIQVPEENTPLPLESASIDLVHCSGVLHHMPNPQFALAEFRRVLRPSGRARIMVYNQASIWYHLYANYLFRIERNLPWSAAVDDVFKMTTDGEDAPVSTCYRSEAFIGLAEAAGFNATHLGNAISCEEMIWSARRFEALRDRRLPEPSRRFLYELALDARGYPTYRGQVAGINSCFLLMPRQR